MKTFYWAWGAVLADLGLFIGPLSMSTAAADFLVLWGLHAGACAVIATAGYLLLPVRYRQPRWAVWLLMADFAFIAPVLGPVGLLLIVHVSLRREADPVRRAMPISVDLPEYDVQSRDPKRAGQGAIRARLTANVPGNVRMQSLLMLQAVPKRVANPILDELLGDAADDVRLLAFGMLDAEEKHLSVHIHRERKNLERPLDARQRYDCLSHLAWLHWELIYASLAQGELRRHMLAEAYRYVEAALALDQPQEAGILFQRGRILLAQGELAAAEQSITAAMALGQPESSALPYLAEIAFQRREFAAVRRFMAPMVGHYVTPRTQAIVDFWTGRDSMAGFGDSRVLAHI
jgi:hypothetical protein